MWQNGGGQAGQAEESKDRYAGPGSKAVGSAEFFLSDKRNQDSDQQSEYNRGPSAGLSGNSD